jgi:hypothetical protein
MGEMTLGDTTIRLRKITITSVCTSLPGYISIHSSRLVESLARRSADVRPNDADFQKECTSQLSAYQSNLLGLHALLAPLGSDKGLANYDTSNDIETLLKNIINLNKSTLDTCAEIVTNIPVLGPILGPSQSFHVVDKNLSDLAIQSFTK